jgi:hypothetical protein
VIFRPMTLRRQLLIQRNARPGGFGQPSIMVLAEGGHDDDDDA